ncbi:MAG: hypothetical protein Q9187_002294 [Circinaria calcarea]
MSLKTEHATAIQRIREESRLPMEKQKSDDDSILRDTVDTRDRDHAGALQALREELAREHAREIQLAEEAKEREMEEIHTKAINLMEEKHKKELDAKNTELEKAKQDLAQLKATKDKTAREKKKRQEMILGIVKSLLQFGTSIEQDKIENMVNDHFVQKFSNIMQSSSKLDANDMRDTQFTIPIIQFPLLRRESTEVTTWEAGIFWFLAVSGDLVNARWTDVLVHGPQSESRLRRLPWVFGALQEIVRRISAKAGQPDYKIEEDLLKSDVIEIYLALQMCAYMHETLHVWPESIEKFDVAAQFNKLSTAITSRSPSILEHSFVMIAMYDYVTQLLSGQQPTQSWTLEASSKGIIPNYEERRIAVLNDTNSGLASGLCLITEPFGLYFLVTNQGSAEEVVFVLREEQILSLEYGVDWERGETTVTLLLGEILGLPTEYQTLPIQYTIEQRRIANYWLNTLANELPRYAKPET